MKKILTIFLMLAWVVPGWAQTFTALTEEGIEMDFTILDEEEKTCMTSEGDGNGLLTCIPRNTRGKVTIPEVVNGYTVVKIGYSSFAFCQLMSEVVIPETVFTIDDCAFLFCYALSKISDISQVLYVGARAFDSTGLREVALGSDDMFSETIIGHSAFVDCTILNKLTIGDNVTSIGMAAFAYCEALETVHIPANVGLIGIHAFTGLTSCKSITVDAANRKYEDKGCNALFDKGQGIILAGCQNTNLAHPEITGIFSRAFEQIPFKNLVIPSNIRIIRENPFVGCPLESIVVDEANPYFDSRDDCNAIIRKEDNVLQTGCKNTAIPSSVETIGYQSFQQVSGMTEALIPEGVEVIENYAFYRCYDLQKVVIPSTVTQIGEASFAGNMDLADVYSYIHEPFYIDEHTFVKTANQLPGMFGSGGIDDVLLHVPKGTLELYQQMPWWILFLNMEEMDDNSAVECIDADKQVQSVHYHNLAGMLSDHPFPGINIVTTTYTDGTTLTTKVIK